MLLERVLVSTEYRDTKLLWRYWRNNLCVHVAAAAYTLQACCHLLILASNCLRGQGPYEGHGRGKTQTLGKKRGLKTPHFVILRYHPGLVSRNSKQIADDVVDLSSINTPPSRMEHYPVQAQLQHQHQYKIWI